MVQMKFVTDYRGSKGLVAGTGEETDTGGRCMTERGASWGRKSLERAKGAIQ